MSDSTSYLPPGTLCVLRGCTDDPRLNGRPVEIVSGPTYFSDESARNNPWYEYTSELTRMENPPGAAVFGLRRCLRPLAPGVDAPAESESEPVPEERTH